jgi:O-antigen ligase
MKPDTEVGLDTHACKPVGSGLGFMVGFFLSFRIVITVFSVRILGTDPQTGTEVRLALNLILLGLVCFTLLGTAKRTISSMLRLSCIRWVLIFLGFSGLSLLWSETVSLVASCGYWFGTVIDVLTVVLLLRTGSVMGVASSLMKGFIWSACAVGLIAWLMPAQYDLRLGDEDYFNANSIANLCAFAIFFTQYLMLRKKEGMWWLATAFLAVTLLRSLSKTTIVAFVLSESFLVIQDRQMTRRAKMFLSSAVIVVILVFWGLFEAYYDFYTTYGNQSETLTGRTAIWAFVLEGALQQPWIGHGFDSMWKVIPPFGSFEARHAENELLEQFYSYGIAGLVILIGVYGSLYRSIRGLPKGRLRIIFVSMLLFIVVRGLAEAEPFDLLLPLWTIVLVSLTVDFAKPANAEVNLPSSALLDRPRTVAVMP